MYLGVGEGDHTIIEKTKQQRIDGWYIKKRFK